MFALEQAMKVQTTRKSIDLFFLQTRRQIEVGG